MHSKFVGHSTEIIWQSKIKGPLNSNQSPGGKLSKLWGIENNSKF